MVRLFGESRRPSMLGMVKGALAPPSLAKKARHAAKNADQQAGLHGRSLM